MKTRIKMSKRLQRGIVLAFFLGALTMIFIPIIVTDSPINTGSDNLAIPETKGIVISPAMQLVRENTCEDYGQSIPPN